jgi:hypothetical protein
MNPQPQASPEGPAADVDPGTEWNDSARSDGAAALLPTDDSGRLLTSADCRFLGIEPRQVQWWSDRSAPLGMTPETFGEFTSSLYDALRADGIDPSQVDVRLQGSSAQFFSGTHKRLPTQEELSEHPEAVARLDEWLGEDTDPPLRRPFDSMYRLGMDDPSDYDIQISSDAMVAHAEQVARSAYSDVQNAPALFHAKYHFLDKRIADVAFPALAAWRGEWDNTLGRDVAPAIFAGPGPPDVSATGPSSRFRAHDWTIKPQESS